MISDELAEAINEQIGMELESASYYLGMAAFLNHENWNGFAHFMKVQAQEELEHAMKFYEFLDEVGQRVRIPSVPEPRGEYDSLEDVFETALNQEKRVTESIHDLLELAVANNDHPADSILRWFVDEQVEEENLMGDHLDMVSRADGDEAALFMLDEKLAQRENGDGGE